jgi:antitoxin VapB
MAGMKEAGRAFAAAPTARAKLFKHGGSQAVRLPKEFRFEGDEVEVRRDGDKIVLTPIKRDLSDLWAKLDALNALCDEPFPDRPEQPPFPEPIRFDDDE